MCDARYREVACRRNGDNQKLDEQYCNASDRPTETDRCDEGECPKWVPTSWSEVSALSIDLEIS